MDARRNEDNRFAVLQRVASGSTGMERAGFRELRVDLPVIVEPPQVLRARDRERDQGRAQRRFAELAVVDAVTRLGKRLEVADEHRPFDELAIVARLEAEHGPRSWNGARSGRRTDRPRRPARRRAVGGPLCSQRQGQQRGGCQPKQPGTARYQCWLVVAAGAASPVPIQCANQVRIRSSRSTSSQGGPVLDKPWKERG